MSIVGRQSNGGTVSGDGRTYRFTEQRIIEESDGTDAEWGFGCSVGALNTDYCMTIPAILRWAEMICCLVIVCCVSSVLGTGPFVGALGGQTFTLILASVCLCLTFMFLIAIFLGHHRNLLDMCPWKILDMTFCVIACILFVVAGILQIYYGTGRWETCSVAKQELGLCPRTYWAWYGAGAFCFCAALLYALSALFAFNKKSYR